MHVMFSSTQSGQTFPLDLGLDKLMISLQKHNAWNADPIPEVLRTCPTIFYPYATYETTYVSHANQWKYYINIYNWFNCKITMYIYIYYTCNWHIMRITFPMIVNSLLSTPGIMIWQRGGPSGANSISSIHQCLRRRRGASRCPDKPNSLRPTPLGSLECTISLNHGMMLNCQLHHDCQSTNISNWQFSTSIYLDVFNAFPWNSRVHP